MSFDMVQGTDRKAQFIGPGLARAPFISFQPGIGVGIIRNQWVPSLNLDVQFIPTRLHNVAPSFDWVKPTGLSTFALHPSLVRRSGFGIKIPRSK